MRLGVIGAGAWGTALAQVAAAGRDDVLLWALEPEVANSINAEHRNGLYLPDVPSPLRSARPTIWRRWRIARRCWWSRRPSISAASSVRWRRTRPSSSAPRGSRPARSA